MTREETVRKLLTELIDMVDNGSQRDSDRADEIGDSIIKLFEQEPILDKIRAEMFEEMQSHSGTGEEVIQAYADGLKKGLDILDKYKAEFEAKDKVSQDRK